jgi:hypothetical protein
LVIDQGEFMGLDTAGKEQFILSKLKPLQNKPKSSSGRKVRRK